MTDNLNIQHLSSYKSTFKNTFKQIMPKIGFIILGVIVGVLAVIFGFPLITLIIIVWLVLKILRLLFSLVSNIFLRASLAALVLFIAALIMIEFGFVTEYGEPLFHLNRVGSLISSAWSHYHTLGDIPDVISHFYVDYFAIVTANYSEARMLRFFSDFYSNFGTEFISIAITVLIIDKLQRRREAKEDERKDEERDVYINRQLSNLSYNISSLEREIKRLQSQLNNR